MLGLLFVTFFIGRVMPVDPVLSIVGERATKEIYEAAYRALGLDKPLIVQFFYYLRDVVQGDFGISLRTGFPVSGDIKRVFPATSARAKMYEAIQREHQRRSPFSVMFQKIEQTGR